MIRLGTNPLYGQHHKDGYKELLEMLKPQAWTIGAILFLQTNLMF